MNKKMSERTRKELAIVLQKEINCYLHNSYFLCTILAFENLRPWFYENYIQLYTSGEKEVRHAGKPEVILDFYGGWTKPKIFFEEQYFDRCEMKEIDIISKIKQCINEERYIYTYVDEFFTIQGMNEHFAHDIYIYGYDDSKEEILVIGFDIHMNFVKYTIPYNSFKNGFKNGIVLSETYDKYGGKRYFFNVKMKVDENYQYKIQMDSVLTLFNDYLHSINTYLHSNDENCDMYKNPNCKYGLATYDEVLKMLKSTYEMGGKTDYRAFHTLYEHKALMKKRLDYFSQILKLNDEEKSLFSEVGQKILELGEQLRLRCIKYNILETKKLLEQMIADVQKLKSLEQQGYLKIYSIIALHKKDIDFE